VQGDEAGYRDVLTMALDEYDAALAIDVNTPYLDAALPARGIVAAARATGKPIAATFMAGKTAAAALPVLIEGGVPDFPTGERGVEVLALLAGDHEARAALAAVTTPSRADARSSSAPTTAQALPGSDAVLAEPAAMDWLESLGFPVPRRAFARTAADAAQAAKALGLPVALKVVASGVVHKSEVGGVVLDLRTQAAVRRAFAALSEKTSAVGFRGALVVPMVHGAVEVLVGLSRDPQFGPVIAAGLGGVAAEALHDVALRVAPITPREARAMLGELRGRAVLGAFRGRAARDVDALVDLIVRVAQLGLAFPDLAELDLNPVFCLERGVVIGDARVVRAGAAREGQPSPTCA
jgi:acyl-CoA synthetase (NDP forming)